LLRGESVVAPLGIAVAAILLLVMGAAGWATVRAERDTLRESRRHEVGAAGTLLGQAAESMLASNDLSALRRLLMQARREHDLAECRITLPNGTVIADAQPAHITRISLPEKWPSGPLDEPRADDDGPPRFNIPLIVPGHGAAMLVIAAGAGRPPADSWSALAGIGLTGACGMVALLLVYRRLRERAWTLGMIRHALLASRGGHDGPNESLSITAAGGPEVDAWNSLLAESRELRAQTLGQKAVAALGAKRGGGGEFEQAFDALSMGIILVNQGGEIAFCNGAAAACLRSKREELWGRDVTPLLPNEDVKKALASGAAGGPGAARSRAMIEIEHQDAQGGGLLRFTVRPLRGDGPRGTLNTIVDITQQRMADDSRNAFIAQATHELRTPLTNMRLYLDMATDDQSDPATSAKALNVIGQECRRLERMVGEMLSVAQIEAGSLEIKRDDVALATVLNQLEADYASPAAEKNITLVFELPPKLPTIQADREKLFLALHNLVGNGLKYTPEGGKVTVTAAADSQALRVEVADTGLGIPPEEHGKIFERFYRAKDSRVRKITGTGLGLTLAREVARLHGGDITVQSQTDKGSAFTLTIPIVEAKT
jgi:signal transduction histidine kinase